MRTFLFLFVILQTLVRAEEPALSKFVKASLTFSAVDSEAPRQYSHALVVYLNLENLHDKDLTWVANVADIEAEILNPSGKPAVQGPRMFSIQSNPAVYHLPFGSHFDWLISSGGGVTIGEYTNHDYALVIGRNAWAIPISQVESYSLRVRVRGFLGNSPQIYLKQFPPKLLLEVPLTKITITKPPPSLPAIPPLERRAERP